MLTGRIEVISQEEAERLDRAAREVLGRVGMRVLNRWMLGRCEAFGWQVDHEAGVVRFPSELIEECTAADRAHPETITAPSVPTTFGVGYGEHCFFVYDWPTKQQVAVGREGQAEMIRLGDAIPEVTAMGLPVLDTRTNQRVEALEAAETILANTAKPCWPGVRLPEQVPYFVEVSRLYERHTGRQGAFIQAGGCLTTPLCLGSRTADIAQGFHERGYRAVGFSSMPIAGGNAPVTPEGTVVMGVAELLGGWMIARALAPDEPTGPGMIISGVLDMRSGRASFGAPEACLQDLAIHDTFLFRYGKTVPLDLGAGYTEARVPGMMAAFEKCFKRTVFGCAVGLGLHLGTIDCARAFSPTQAMLDLDYSEWSWRFFRGLSVSPETLALEVIADVGCGEGKSFLQHDHTLANWRCLWSPRFWDRRAWQDGETESRRDREVIEHADAKWRKILAAAPPPKVNEVLVAEVGEVVARARRDLTD
ncbi:trimethylamine methyltransferase family protein [bacterium]|nr:trimethylamine methyltransferase family protein [bacterium]